MFNGAGHNFYEQCAFHMKVAARPCRRHACNCADIFHHEHHRRVVATITNTNTTISTRFVALVSRERAIKPLSRVMLPRVNIARRGSRAVTSLEIIGQTRVRNIPNGRVSFFLPIHVFKLAIVFLFEFKNITI